MRQGKQKCTSLQVIICAAAPAKSMDKYSRDTSGEGASTLQEWALQSGITSPKLKVADFAGERYSSGIKRNA